MTAPTWIIQSPWAQPQTASTTANLYWLPMFTPTGSGALYYHNLAMTQATQTATWSGLNAPYAAQQAIWSQVVPPPSRLERPPPRLSMPAILRGRRALRRSIDLFRRFRPEEEIRTFLSGRPLVVRGHRYDYRVRRNQSLLRHTMNPTSGAIPYDLHALRKADGTVLAKGCVIVPNTPVIDQLLALILHVQDPLDEDYMIRTTVWDGDLRRAA